MIFFFLFWEGLSKPDKGQKLERNVERKLERLSEKKEKGLTKTSERVRVEHIQT